VEGYVPTHEGFEIIFMEMPELKLFNSNIKHSWANVATREVIAQCDAKTCKMAMEIVGEIKIYPIKGNRACEKVKKLADEIGLHKAIGFANYQKNIFAPDVDSHSSKTGIWDWRVFAAKIKDFSVKGYKSVEV
jgi:hypothetical protein